MVLTQSAAKPNNLVAYPLPPPEKNPPAPI